MRVEPHQTLVQLQALYRKEENKRLARRIQGVYLAKTGRTCREIMAVTCSSRRTVQKWLARYNRGGLKELFEKTRSGQPTKLSVKREEEFRRRIHRGPTPKDGVSVWNAKAIRNILRREFGRVYSTSGFYNLLNRVEYSTQSRQ